MKHSETLPLFIADDEHQALVRVMALPWPLEGVAYEVWCPACPIGGGLLYESYDSAFLRASDHRILRGAPIRPEDREEAREIEDVGSGLADGPIAAAELYLLPKASGSGGRPVGEGV